MKQKSTIMLLILILTMISGCSTFKHEKAVPYFQNILVGEIVKDKRGVSLVTTEAGDRIISINVRIIREMKDVKKLDIQSDYRSFYIAPSLKSDQYYRFDRVNLQPVRDGLKLGDWVLLYFREDMTMPAPEIITVKFEI